MPRFNLVVDMTQADFDKIQQELQIKLPAHYIKFMENPSGAFVQLKALAPHQPFLYEHAEELIKINQHLGFHGSDTFIKQRLCIGDNGGGDFYLIDLQTPDDPRVFLLDHEETVAIAYDAATDTWDWDQVEYAENISTHINETLEMFNIEL